MTEFMDVKELMEEGDKHQEEMDKVFEYDVDLNILTLKMAYPYHIELDRIKSKADLLGWVVQREEVF